MRDRLGKNTDALKEKRLFLLDMDGTIYLDATPFEGTARLLSAIESVGGAKTFITNNSSKSVSDYVAKLQAMNIPGCAEEFFTSSQATALYLKAHFPGKRIYCMGTHSLVEELTQNGISVTDQVDPACAAIVVGFDTELTFAKLEATCRMLLLDIPFIATNPDMTCPTAFGYVPDCGAVCQMLYHATKRTPFVIGKPRPAIVQYAIERSAFTPEQAVVIGDRLYTDIASGVNAGVTSILVLSGEATLEDLERSEVKPDYVLEDVGVLAQILGM